MKKMLMWAFGITASVLGSLVFLPDGAVIPPIMSVIHL